MTFSQFAIAFIEFTMVRHWFLSLAVILGFTAFTFTVDSKGLKGEGENLFITACRIYAKNVKLFLGLVLTTLAFMTLVGAAVMWFAPKQRYPMMGGGPESEKFFGMLNFATAPLRWTMEVAKNLISVLAIVFLICVHFAGVAVSWKPMLTLTVIVLLYLGWLLGTTWKVVSEEYGGKATLWRAVSALVPAQATTWFLFIVFLGSIQTGLHWLGSLIPA